MLVREDFYRILRETIIEYTRIVLHKDIKCEYEPFDTCEPWVINTALGFVSRVPAPGGVKTYMRSEFNVRGSRLKNLIGKTAVDVISLFPRLGSTKKIYVSKGAIDKEVFIVPQNRSIRFYNYATMIVDCIVKSGFTSKYFDNQATFRKQYHYDFLNPMIENGDGWFREPILTGHPLVRTTDENLFKAGTELAIRYLKELAADTLEWKQAKSYVDTISAEIKGKLMVAKEKKGVKEAENALVIVDRAVMWANEYDDELLTCVSHGDFQSGNIWIEPNGRTLIYDWETTGRRSVWYDSTTLSYSLRRAYGWASLMEDAYGKGMRLCVPDGVETKASVRSMIGVVLLEDMLFYLDDMLELPETWGRDDFDGFVNNIKMLNWE